MPPVPVPMITPTRRRSRSFQRSSRQESFTACTAAPIANWAKRSYRRASFFSRYSDGSHCFTSWANLTGRSAESKRVIGPAPDFPATSASHVSATVLPSGVTSPRPVTATRRRTYFPIFSWRYCIAAPTVFSFSASSSGMSMSNSFSKAITSSTVSRLSAPRSSMKLALLVSLSRSTPSSSTMMSLTFSSSCFMSMAMVDPSAEGWTLAGSHYHPAVDDQHLSCNVARQVGSKKEHGVCDILALPQAPERNGRLEGLFHLVRDGFRHLGRDVPRRDRIHEHVPRRQLLRHALREPDQPGLRGGIIRLPLVARQPHHARDIDDPPPAALDHPPGCELGKEEGGLQVRIQHGVPVVGADPEQQVVLRDPGVVHQHVDGTEVLLDGLDQPLDLRLVGDVAGVAFRSAQRGRRGFRLHRVAPADRHLRARTDQRLGDGVADPARASGYQDGLPGEGRVH